MGSVVKKVAPIALMAAGGYAAFAGPGLATGASNLGHLGRFAASAGGSLFSVSNVISAGGLLMQGASNIQSRKYQKSQSMMQTLATQEKNKSDAARNRYNNLLQKRQRLTEIRSARIRQGQIEGDTAGSQLGAGGTSSFAGAVGATGTQASANLGNINVAENVGNQITGFNTMAANYQTGANQAESNAKMWNQMDVLGGTLMTQGKGIANIFGLG